MMYEDIWVFRSIFGVIHRINQRPVGEWLDILDGAPPTNSAVDQANVPIKQINYCDLAQYAMSVATGAGGGFSVGTNGTEAEDQRIVTGRYIDGRNQPVEDPSSPPFTEFKQIFMQLSVVMDQRLIPVLISECANADITIETRQVLIDLSQVDVPRKAAADEAAKVANKIESTPNDVVVTVRGVLYGYSPPDIARLGAGSDPEPSKRDYGIPKKN
jgi:hypothetical protein